MLPKNATCSIIVPTYNEEMTIAESLATIVRTFEGREREIVVINDGSSDGTAAAIERFAGIPRVKIIHHSVNCGKGAALRTGIAHASGDIVAFCDADLELDPTDLRRLVDLLDRGHERVAYGWRRFPPGGGWKSLVYRIGNRVLNLIGNLLFFGHIVDMECGYKVFRRQAIRSLPLRCNRFDIEPEISYTLLTRRMRILQSPIAYRPRTHAMGKKIRAWDGLMAIVVMLRLRLIS